MWKVTVNEIKVPECEVEFSDKGLLTLGIKPDFQELDKLKALPSPGDNAFTVSAETDLVSLSFKACRLIAFNFEGHTPLYDSNKGYRYLRTARLTFEFKCSDKDKWKEEWSDEENRRAGALWRDR